MTGDDADLPRWPTNSAAGFVDDLISWFERSGRHCYEEDVSQLDHALQAAWLAERAQDSDAAIAAALLHDVGHMLMPNHAIQADFSNVDFEHEIIGARWLSQMFPRDVVGPIAGHVLAKRYLCTVDSSYRQRLSDASKRSFILQDGPLSAQALRAAEKHPDHARSIVLRRRDDAAKVAGRSVPDLAAWRSLLESLVVMPPINELS